jgi:hypothetical protein
MTVRGGDVPLSPTAAMPALKERFCRLYKCPFHAGFLDRSSPAIFPCLKAGVSSPVDSQFGPWGSATPANAALSMIVKMALMAGSIAPGSALSCLDELAGGAVESACEKGVFASPEAVAAAVKYVTAQLALLEDGTAYAKRDASYAAELAPLRSAVERSAS